MLLNCPNCSSTVGGDEINIARNIAHCSNCDHVFRISDAMGETFNNDHKTQIVMPEGIQVVPGLQLDIQLTWRKLSRWGLHLFIGLIFGGLPGFMLFFITAVENDVPFFVYPFLSLFILVGAYMFFRGLSYFLNTTYITASSFEVRVDHRPINFLGWRNLSIPKSEVTQLFVERIVESKTNNRPNYAYNLLAVLENGEQEYLIRGLKKAEVAFYLEHQIEQRLGLEDQPMDGEFIPGQSGRNLMLQSLAQLEKMPKFLQRIVERQLDKQKFK
ncbi:MAG: hypothetical protein AAFP77_26775 [Bacteroidota bacterium]